MYHSCEERETDFTRGLSINTTPAHFAAQLDFLRKYYQIVPLSALGRESIPDRAVVITFDDGFRSVYEQAFPQLRARNLPATCYLTTDVLAGRGIIWLNELNWFLERHPAVVMPLVSQRLGLSPCYSRVGFIQQVIAHYDRETIRDLLAELRIRTGAGPERLVESPLYLDHEQIGEMSQIRVHIRQSLRIACGSVAVVGSRMPRGNYSRWRRTRFHPGIDPLARLSVRSIHRFYPADRPGARLHDAHGSGGQQRPVGSIARRSCQCDIDFAGCHCSRRWK